MLFKCSCSCFFSIKEIRSDAPCCPNCGEYARMTDYTRFSTLKDGMTESGMTVQMIPDNARVQVSFDI